MTDTVQLGNPIKIIIYVKQPDGNARDLTGATGLKIKLKNNRASAAGKSFDAVLEGLATTGAVSCELSTGDIDALATWKAQAYYTLSGKSFHTRPVEIFYVEGNLA